MSVTLKTARSARPPSMIGGPPTRPLEVDARVNGDLDLRLDLRLSRNADDETSPAQAVTAARVDRRIDLGLEIETRVAGEPVIRSVIEQRRRHSAMVEAHNQLA